MDLLKTFRTMILLNFSLWGPLALAVNTPNMGLLQPTVGVDSGLTWENSVNSNSSVIDQHNHTPGYGAQIPPAGLNINSALTFRNNAATNLQASVYSPQASLATLNAVYTIGADLWYNDGNGNAIKITTGGGVNATSSGISSGTASCSFSGATLVCVAAPVTPANIEGGSILIGNNVANSKFLTLAPPTAMASNFTETLPTLPAQTSFMTMDTSGNMAAPIATNQGIQKPNLAPLGQQLSGSSGGYFTSTSTYETPTDPNPPHGSLSVSITTTGRPVMLALVTDGSLVDLSQFQIVGANTQWRWHFTRDGVSLGENTLFFTPSSPFSICWPLGSFMMVDTGASAASHTYAFQIKQASGSATASVAFAKLISYEL